MIPAALIGILFNDEIEFFFGSELVLVGFMLILTGLLLLLADNAKASKKNVTIKSALLIGVSQAIAILPGISRSGATISTSVMLGVDKERSARFSFLMVVPLIVGSMAKSILDTDTIVADTSLFPLIIGFIAAFFTGLAACKWMINIVKKAQLKYFSWYCFVIGIFALILA